MIANIDIYEAMAKLDCFVILFLNKQINSSQHVMFNSFGGPQCQRLKYRFPERNLGSSSFFDILWLYYSNFNFSTERKSLFSPCFFFLVV